MNPPPSREWLESLYRTHHRADNLFPDPLVFARGYSDPRDGEIAGLLSAAFSYGQVGKIMEALGRVFSVVGGHPLQFIMTASSKDIAAELDGFCYRFHKQQDVTLFLHLLRNAVEQWGSIGGAFFSGDRGGDVGEALAVFSSRILGGDARPLLATREVPAGHPVRFFLASPRTGGAAKRLCLFLRWMARRDEIDPGYWFGRLDPGRLVVPLDTHVAKVGVALGFTQRRAADWKTATEITEALRAYDPSDPVRYDFSLFRFGMNALGPGPGRSIR